jgi:hypothetical protein
LRLQMRIEECHLKMKRGLILIRFKS